MSDFIARTIICLVAAGTLTFIIFYMMPDIGREFRRVFRKKDPPKKPLIIRNGITIYDKRGKKVI